MRNKMGSLADWATFEGQKAVPFPGDGSRPLRFEGVTEGASVRVIDDRGATLVFTGVGRFDVDCGVVGETVVEIDGDGTTSLRIEGVKPREVGWTDGPSITDLEPKRFGDMSPEVAAMFQTLQANMLAREARILEEVRKKRG